jgi:hypothetical protein
MARDFGTAMDNAKKQIEDGAHVIDINVDDGILDGRSLSRLPLPTQKLPRSYSCWMYPNLRLSGWFAVVPRKVHHNSISASGWRKAV